MSNKLHKSENLTQFEFDIQNLNLFIAFIILNFVRDKREFWLKKFSKSLMVEIKSNIKNALIECFSDSAAGTIYLVCERFENSVIPYRGE